MSVFLKLLRIPHYIKNLLCFAALAPSGQLLNGTKLMSAFIAFLCFCALSSAIYIFNDIKDKENDKFHSVKCLRPIAAGQISIRTALLTGFILLLLSGVVNYFFLGSMAGLFLAAYLVLNLAYTFKLKELPLVDVAILVSGFLLRLGYGAFVTDIKVSKWLYLTLFALMFYFALGKRRNELARRKDERTRKVLKAYSLEFCSRNMYMCLTLANTFYALWCVDKDITALHGECLLFSIPLVLLISMRYSMVIEGDSDGDPVEVLLKDKILCALCLFYALLMFFFVYGKKLL